MSTRKLPPSESFRIAWLDIERCIMGLDIPATPHDAAFHIARHAMAILADHDIDPYRLPLHTVARHVHAALVDHHPDAPATDIAEYIHHAWPTIYAPEGYSPVQWAYRRTLWLKRPQRATGKYATPRQQRLATTLLNIFLLLPKDTDGNTYASIRTLAKTLHLPKSTIHLALTQLTRNNLLLPTQTHTTTRSTRYQTPHHPLDRSNRRQILRS